MRESLLTLHQASENVQVAENELRHAAQRGEIEAVERGGEWHLDAMSLHDWAQRRLIAADVKNLSALHRALDEHRRKVSGDDTSIARLFCEDAINIALRSKTKAGVLRDMTDLADRSGMVYDADALFRGLAEREEVASTAIGAGAAFLHMKECDPYVFENFFIAYGRCDKPVYFGAPDGAPTRHFFLVCSTSRERHLHALARLSMLSHAAGLLEALDGAQSPGEALAAIGRIETDWLADAGAHGARMRH